MSDQSTLAFIMVYPIKHFKDISQSDTSAAPKKHHLKVTLRMKRLKITGNNSYKGVPFDGESRLSPCKAIVRVTWLGDGDSVEIWSPSP